MTEVIIEIQNIIPATGWFFGDRHLLTNPLSEYEPVVIFVQALVFDANYPKLGTEKKVIPLGAENYSDINSLIGINYSEFEKEIFYITQYENNL
ncbi:MULTISPECIES: hypothetical protein [unclassified Pannonibacter]|uniref:hypothetical protein n=1 Tax=unclassified Pannonibacter TaxID=2627228 RepID=UPI00164532F5|nr:MULTISPECIES: hypothetical protein [unclassified Pannonibacter]